MKIKMIYVCEFCGQEYGTEKEAYACEARCLGLNRAQYAAYRGLLEDESRAYSVTATVNNPETRARCERATRAVLEFQEKHGITDNR